jgi:HEAT repeat protein
MENKKIGGRKLKKIIAELLRTPDFEQGLDAICQLPARQAVNPLFSSLCSPDERVKWRAVTAMGRVVSDLAAIDFESARVIMRRFIWQLNDESGGIGWGCPESMAEAMAQNERLAEEYGCMLISYIQPAGNFLEHEILQRGVVWGIGRLAHNRPAYVRSAAALLLPYMESADPILRGLAVWAAIPIAGPESIARFQQLANDRSELCIYNDGRMLRYSVDRLAGIALAAAEECRLNP